MTFCQDPWSAPRMRLKPGSRTERSSAGRTADTANTGFSNNNNHYIFRLDHPYVLECAVCFLFGVNYLKLKILTRIIPFVANHWSFLPIWGTKKTQDINYNLYKERIIQHFNGEPIWLYLRLTLYTMLSQFSQKVLWCAVEKRVLRWWWWRGVCLLLMNRNRVLSHLQWQLRGFQGVFSIAVFHLSFCLRLMKDSGSHRWIESITLATRTKSKSS